MKSSALLPKFSEFTLWSRFDVFSFGVIFFFPLNEFRRKDGKAFQGTPVIERDALQMFLLLFGLPCSIIRAHAWKARSWKTGQAAGGSGALNSRSACLASRSLLASKSRPGFADSRNGACFKWGFDQVTGNKHHPLEKLSLLLNGLSCQTSPLV